MQNGLGPVGPKVFEFDKEKGTLIPLYDSTKFGNPESYKKDFFAVWPLGYPISILAISNLTTLDPLWASKLLNIILLAVDFYLLFLLFGEFSLLSIFYFGSFTMLENVSYTWSENLFITTFLLLFYALNKLQQKDTVSYKYISLLSIALFGMCFSRYASAIFYSTPLLFFIYYGRKKEWSKVVNISIGVTLSLVLLIAYLYYNYIQTGYITGMPRIGTQEFTFIELTQKFFIGQFNQLHIIKQFRFSGKSDFLFYCSTTLLQLILMGIVTYQLVRKPLALTLSFLQRLLLASGFIYLVFITYMTFTSTIDAFDYRTLLPYSFPIMVVILTYVEQKLFLSNNEKIITLLKLFFVFSLLMNLPKKFIIESIF